MQIRNYYNKTELPPYGEYEAEANTQVVTLTPAGPQAVGQPAPNLSIITIDVNMGSDTDGASTPDKVGTTPGYPNGAHQQDRPTVITVQIEGTKKWEGEEGWKRDAVTMTEEDYILKHYYNKAETSNSGIPMEMYLGLCTGRLLSMSLLLAITEVQLPKKWHGLRCRDFMVMTQPQENGQCSPTSLRSRAAI